MKNENDLTFSFFIFQVRRKINWHSGTRIIRNLLKSARSHILKSRVFAFAVLVFVVINSLVKQVLDFPFFSLSDLLRNRIII